MNRWLRGPFRRINNDTAARIFSSFSAKFLSTSKLDESSKIYELRNYSVHPKDINNFLDLSNKWLHLRTKYSKLIGYWRSEIGGPINELVHIWEYDSLNHRAEVRKALAADPAWIENYFSKILPMLQKQENSLCKMMIREIPLAESPGKGGVYEMQHIVIGKGMEKSVTAINKIERPSATLLGCWNTVLGVQPIGFLLWHHPSQDNVTNTLYKFDEDSGLTQFYSRILIPTSWSPMQ